MKLENKAKKHADKQMVIIHGYLYGLDWYILFSFKFKEIETANEQAYSEKEDLLDSLRKQVRINFGVCKQLIDFKMALIYMLTRLMSIGVRT